MEKDADRNIQTDIFMTKTEKEGVGGETTPSYQAGDLHTAVDMQPKY